MFASSCKRGITGSGRMDSSVTQRHYTMLSSSDSKLEKMSAQC